jgi:hypothetical protein
VKDNERDKPLGSSTIAPLGNLIETILSADHLSMSSLLGVYVKTPLLPTDYESAVRYIGKEMKLVLPITIDGKTMNYELSIKVTESSDTAEKILDFWFVKEPGCLLSGKGGILFPFFAPDFSFEEIGCCYL